MRFHVRVLQWIMIFIMETNAFYPNSLVPFLSDGDYTHESITEFGISRVIQELRNQAGRSFPVPHNRGKAAPSCFKIAKMFHSCILKDLRICTFLNQIPNRTNIDKQICTWISAFSVNPQLPRFFNLTTERFRQLVESKSPVRSLRLILTCKQKECIKVTG